MVDMKGLMIGELRFVALLLMACFLVVTVMCTVLMANMASAGNSAHCTDEPALADCLISKIGHGAMNGLVLVNVLLLMVGGVVLVLKHKINELQENYFGRWWQSWCAKILCFQDYLIVLFSKGIVRSKIYGSV